MEMKLKKLWPLIGALCVSAFSPAFADSYQYSNSSQPNHMQQSGQNMYQRGSAREITPDAGPRVSSGADVFITADFIWWKATQEGTQYAFSGVKTATSTTTPFQSVSKGSLKSVGDDWAPGFKVGLGLNMSHDGWDLYAQYTWLRPSNSSSLSSAGGVSAQTIGVGGNTGPFTAGSSARATWDLDFNVIDLELGRNFYLSQFLTMRPFIGLKGTWQSQDFNVRFSGDNFALDSAAGSQAVTGPYHSRNDIDNWGIGARGGLNVSWYMSKNWSIYGDMSWTALWTDYYEFSRKDTLDDATTGTTTTVGNLSASDFYSVKYIGELELGLRWEMWFSNDNYHFAIQAGWEEQVWINWIQFVELLDYSWQDLNLHGLNLKFRFDF